MDSFLSPILHNNVVQFLLQWFSIYEALDWFKTPLIKVAVLMAQSIENLSSRIARGNKADAGA